MGFAQEKGQPRFLSPRTALEITATVNFHGGSVEGIVIYIDRRETSLDVVAWPVQRKFTIPSTDPP